MRNDHPHAPAHLVVSRSLPVVPMNPEKGGSPSGFLEHGSHEVAQLLRLRPFLIETRFQNFMVGHDIAGGDWFADLGEDLADREGVELHVGVEIELLVVRVEVPSVVIKVPALAGYVQEVQPRRQAADEPGGLRKHVWPQRRVERGVVDAADQR
jgi:hypothetical protein